MMEVKNATLSKSLPLENAQVVRTRYAVTSDNVRELIKAAERKENTLTAKQSHSQIFRVQNSNWTPIIHKPSSDQVSVLNIYEQMY
jgi:hypothetical protein